MTPVVEDMVRRPSVLLLSTRADYACDFVVSALRDASISYLRLNTEDLESMELALDPSAPRLRARTAVGDFLVEPDSVDGILFRRPVFLRESAAGGSGAERLARAQWGAFVRSLMVFEGARWVNHPARVYYAEHKAVQLRVAHQVGFRVPETSIANALSPLHSEIEQFAIKGLDAISFGEGDQEFFGYTQLVSRAALNAEDLTALPTIIQAAVVPKLDLRVTVVGDQMWCAEIYGPAGPVDGDWRELKSSAVYRAREVASDLRERILALMNRLGLVYAAIDLAEHEGEIFFLEVNPTGEWAWLERGLGFPVSQALCRALSGSPR